MMAETAQLRGFFAADMIPGNANKTYSYQKPGEILARLVDIGQGNLELDHRQMAEFASGMPEVMTGVDFSSKGEMKFKSYTKNDFLGTGTNGSSIAGSGIVSILAADTIMEGAMPFVSARKVVKTLNMRTETETVPFFTSRRYLKAKSSGADATDLAENLGKAILQAETYSVTCGLDKGLLKDASGDLTASVLKEMGGSMEMTLDRLVVSGLLATSDTVEASVAADDALSGLLFARGQVGANGFMPSGAICTPMFMAKALAKAVIPAYNENAQALQLGSGAVNRWFGMELGESGITADADKTSEKWGWGAANDNGAIVLDNTRAGVLGIRADMEFEEFDNITKYILNPVLTSRFAWVSAADIAKTTRTNAKAVVRVTRSA
jgi:hypothetical protein